MADPFEEFQVELDALRKKHGIETYLFCVQSPFSENVYTNFGGSSAWIAGQGLFMSDLMCKRWNSDLV